MNQRSARLVKDKFALVWDSFIENCSLCYVPGANITVDEQLFPTKARCKFTQYMANKPDQFGIKFWLAADVDTKYLLNGSPYLDNRLSKNTPLYDTIVMKNNETTLTVYEEKKDKNVLMLSTLHPNISFENDQKYLPETVSFYNATKYGVDVLDQMARKYSVIATSRHWPVQ
ncbi:hypothetical protein PR048_026924, partial [Dryococelus australis]